MQPGDSTSAMRRRGPAAESGDHPHWTGAHRFNALVNLAGPLQASSAEGSNGQVLASQGAGQPHLAQARRRIGGLIFAFNTSTAVADPGAQKALQQRGLRIRDRDPLRIASQTNFDASTILTLLTTGNRIYLQQRNDATRAAIYQ
jgi:hypothetical protein